MPSLPRKKVGIVACSGEELPEGTVTRLAALRVLELLRPRDTVTICLPLFLAGGEGDRAFARFYPTVAVDGCDKRCAARATEMYSGKPAASVVVTSIVAERTLGPVEGRRRLNDAGVKAVYATAEIVAQHVDMFLEARGASDEATPPAEPIVAACSCGSGIPVQTVRVGQETVSVLALPVIFEQFWRNGKLPVEETGRELMEMVRIYNAVPAGVEQAYASALLREYAAFLRRQEAQP